jgi:hypothetical protein
MDFKRLKARYVRKLLQAKFFVLLTDKESAIALDGADPDSFSDMLALNAQAAALLAFRDNLNALIRDHDRAIERLSGTGGKRAKTVKKSTKRAKAK